MSILTSHGLSCCGQPCVLKMYGFQGRHGDMVFPCFSHMIQKHNISLPCTSPETSHQSIIHFLLILESQQKETSNSPNKYNPNHPKTIQYQHPKISWNLGTPKHSASSGGLPQFSIFKEKLGLCLHVLCRWGALKMVASVTPATL